MHRLITFYPLNLQWIMPITVFRSPKPEGLWGLSTNRPEQMCELPHTALPEVSFQPQVQGSRPLEVQGPAILCVTWTSHWESVYQIPPAALYPVIPEQNTTSAGKNEHPVPLCSLRDWDYLVATSPELWDIWVTRHKCRLARTLKREVSTWDLVLACAAPPSHLHSAAGSGESLAEGKHWDPATNRGTGSKPVSRCPVSRSNALRKLHPQLQNETCKDNK